MRRDDVCRGETVRVGVAFQLLTSELFSLDATVVPRLRELRR